jgi:hypothetical protein
MIHYLWTSYLLSPMQWNWWIKPKINNAFWAFFPNDEQSTQVKLKPQHYTMLKSLKSKNH